MTKKHRLILVTLFGICALIYYLGELLNIAGWGAGHQLFLDEVHDIHRLLFLAPMIYACYFFGLKVMAIVSTASLIVFLPRAILISPFPDATARSVVFVVSTGALCLLVRISLTNIQKRARVETMSRSNDKDTGVQNAIGDEVFTAGDLEVNLSRRLVRRRGQIVKLTPKEYGLLVFLITNNGKVMHHSELLQSVWGQEYGGEREYIRNYIMQLRQKIEDDPSNPHYIITESHFGYRFTECEGMPNNDPS
jgi:DNA-binding winged helix-turn-helix (wHTH) protein